MKYTVQLDFFIDEDAVRTDEEVKEVVEEIFDYGNCSASNIKVIDVNDWSLLNSHSMGERRDNYWENIGNITKMVRIDRKDLKYMDVEHKIFTKKLKTIYLIQLYMGTVIMDMIYFKKMGCVL